MPTHKCDVIQTCHHDTAAALGAGSYHSSYSTQSKGLETRSEQYQWREGAGGVVLVLERPPAALLFIVHPIHTSGVKVRAGLYFGTTSRCRGSSGTAHGAPRYTSADGDAIIFKLESQTWEVSSSHVDGVCRTHPHCCSTVAMHILDQRHQRCSVDRPAPPRPRTM